MSQARSLSNGSLFPDGGDGLGDFELASFDAANMARALDLLRREIDGLGAPDAIDNLVVLKVSAGTGTVLGVGFVSWVLRGGALTATLLSTVPMWKGFGPLPMLMGRRNTDDEDQDENDGESSEEISTTKLRELRLENMFSKSGSFKTGKGYSSQKR